MGVEARGLDPIWNRAYLDAGTAGSTGSSDDSAPETLDECFRAQLSGDLNFGKGSSDLLRDVSQA